MKLFVLRVKRARKSTNQRFLFIINAITRPYMMIIVDVQSNKLSAYINARIIMENYVALCSHWTWFCTLIEKKRMWPSHNFSNDLTRKLCKATATLYYLNVRETIKVFIFRNQSNITIFFPTIHNVTYYPPKDFLQFIKLFILKTYTYTHLIQFLFTKPCIFFSKTLKIFTSIQNTIQSKIYNTLNKSASQLRSKAISYAARTAFELHSSERCLLCAEGQLCLQLAIFSLPFNFLCATR